jgi:hypothetical protein
LITAIVGFLTFVYGRPEDRKEGTVREAAIVTTAQPQAVQPAQPVSPSAHAGPRNLDECREIVGAWDWFTGGIVTIDPDGALAWRRSPADAAPSAVGRWSCMAPGSARVNLAWQTGLVDSVSLSPDGRSLAGSNQSGIGVSGTRRGAEGR